MKNENFLKIFFVLFVLVFINVTKTSYGDVYLRPSLDFSKTQKKKSVLKFSEILFNKGAKKDIRPENPYMLFDKKYSRGNIAIDENTIVVGTGGGDVALNTLIAEIAKLAYSRGLRVVGVRNCYDGMVADDWEDNLVEITPDVGESMRDLPSTVLGSCRRLLSKEDLERIIKRFGRAKGMIITGGNDHLKGVENISNASGGKLSVIGIPKSIDNDFKTAMFGYKNAYSLGRKMAAWLASIDPIKEENVVVVVEVMGRKSGSLTLDSAQGCPYPKAVLVPEKKADLKEILNVVEKNGVRYIFVSEGVTFSKKDPVFQDLLASDSHLRERFETADKNPKLDAHGNPLLRGTSLYVAGALERFLGKEVRLASITYPTRGIWHQKDKHETWYFDDYLSTIMAIKALELIDESKTGLAITYYGYDIGRHVITKPCRAVYKSKNLNDTHTNKQLAKLGVLGVKGTDFSPNKNFVIEDSNLTKEEAARQLFNSVNISTRTHSSLKTHLVSTVEMGLPSGTIVRACGRIQPDIERFEKPLKMIIETTKDSVMILIPEKPVSFKEIAKNIKKITKKFGYANIAVSKDFKIYKDDPLLISVLKRDAALREKFNNEAIDAGEGYVVFKRDVSKFIRGLCEYLKKKPRRTNLDYSFEALAEETSKVRGILSSDSLLAQYGVLGTSLESRLKAKITRAASDFI